MKKLNNVKTDKLCEDVKSGKKNAKALFYKKYKEKILIKCYLMLYDIYDSEDQTELSFDKFFTKIDKDRLSKDKRKNSIQSCIAFLKKISHNCCLDSIRKRNRMIIVDSGSGGNDGDYKTIDDYITDKKSADYEKEIESHKFSINFDIKQLILTKLDECCNEMEIDNIETIKKRIIKIKIDPELNLLIKLTVIEGMKVFEAAQKLGMKTNKAYNRRNYLIDKLRTIIPDKLFHCFLDY
ncbi:hypothetical protein MHK_011007 [Candidatus Magnetomorum sp. HK-1]|nr:hypothetical protein MHK_011007 [Candidatus Magnetomorum sp. HK-1]